MKKLLLIFIFYILFGNINYSQGKYENSQFSINALVTNESTPIDQPLMMFLPPTDGFSPNVNVQIQQYSKSLKDYFNLSISQFEQLKFKIYKKIISMKKVIFEYSGIMNRQNLHWYALAYKKGNNVYLITATAKQSQWKLKSKELISCVESFRLK